MIRFWWRAGSRTSSIRQLSFLAVTMKLTEIETWFLIQRVCLQTHCWVPSSYKCSSKEWRICGMGSCTLFHFILEGFQTSLCFSQPSGALHLSQDTNFSHKNCLFFCFLLCLFVWMGLRLGIQGQGKGKWTSLRWVKSCRRGWQKSKMA